MYPFPLEITSQSLFYVGMNHEGLIDQFLSLHVVLHSSVSDLWPFYVLKNHFRFMLRNNSQTSMSIKWVNIECVYIKNKQRCEMKCLFILLKCLCMCVNIKVSQSKLKRQIAQVYLIHNRKVLKMNGGCCG